MEILCSNYENGFCLLSQAIFDKPIKVGWKTCANCQANDNPPEIERCMHNKNGFCLLRSELKGSPVVVTFGICEKCSFTDTKKQLRNGMRDCRIVEKGKVDEIPLKTKDVIAWAEKQKREKKLKLVMPKYTIAAVQEIPPLYERGLNLSKFGLKMAKGFSSRLKNEGFVSAIKGIYCCPQQIILRATVCGKCEHQGFDENGVEICMTLKRKAEAKKEKGCGCFLKKARLMADKRCEVLVDPNNPGGPCMWDAVDALYNIIDGAVE